MYASSCHVPAADTPWRRHSKAARTQGALCSTIACTGPYGRPYFHLPAYAPADMCLAAPVAVPGAAIISIPDSVRTHVPTATLAAPTGGRLRPPTDHW